MRSEQGKDGVNATMHIIQLYSTSFLKADVCTKRRIDRVYLERSS